MKNLDLSLKSQPDSVFAGDTPDPAANKTLDYLKRVHDVYMPQKLLDFAMDHIRHNAYEKVIRQIVAGGTVKTALHTGLGSVFAAMISAKAGVREVLLCEPLHHMASIYGALIAENNLSRQVKIITKKFNELELKSDFTQPPDLLVLDCIDCGLLGHGIASCVKYARKNLLGKESAIVPARATVYALPVELRTGEICGFDLNGFNRYRRCTACKSIRLADEPFKPLAEPFASFALDFYTPLARAERTFHVTVKNPGIFNAVASWFELHLDDETTLSTSPGPKCPPGPTAGPAVS